MATSTVGLAISPMANDQRLTVNDYAIYIHEGNNVTYTLPTPSTRIGKSWKIINIRTGVIITSLPFHEGDTTRSTIINKSGPYSYTLFSDGTKYIAL